ncbi:Schizosaccharomyces specific protein [Schizosaccharomyces osmophilus]|uniref:Schizosaccharomyces specific protein n=1 Tax=Schizosaccharomyces osmophilus TaxID=2545709 RepID=A0AAF0AXC1_9SCHI|nr:Schizosaccharomyces specific protein [Schizosaccharomyces osmophilus]WBW74642.1 Schizosaccharomyces specific protein [Schizosaccharomyces osmophilus]
MDPSKTEEKHELQESNLKSKQIRMNEWKHPSEKVDGRWLQLDARVNRTVEDLEISNHNLQIINEGLERKLEEITAQSSVQEKQAPSSLLQTKANEEKVLLHSVNNVLDNFISIVDGMVQQAQDVLDD